MIHLASLASWRLIFGVDTIAGRLGLGPGDAAWPRAAVVARRGGATPQVLLARRGRRSAAWTAPTRRG